MRIGAVAGMLALAMLPSVCVAASGDAAVGKDTFHQKCAACHGPEGKGDGPAAKVAKLTMPDLGSKEVQSLSDASIKKVITEGKDKMKAVPGLSGSDLSNLVAFIRTLAKK